MGSNFCGCDCNNKPTSDQESDVSILMKYNIIIQFSSAKKFTKSIQK
jgi:hypothetical protein